MKTKELLKLIEGGATVTHQEFGQNYTNDGNLMYVRSSDKYDYYKDSVYGTIIRRPAVKKYQGSDK